MRLPPYIAQGSGRTPQNAGIREVVRAPRGSENAAVPGLAVGKRNDSCRIHTLVAVVLAVCTVVAVYTMIQYDDYPTEMGFFWNHSARFTNPLKPYFSFWLFPLCGFLWFYSFAAMRGWKTADPLPAESSDPSCSRRLVAMRKLASGSGGGGSICTYYSCTSGYA